MNSVSVGIPVNLIQYCDFFKLFIVKSYKWKIWLKKTKRNCKRHIKQESIQPGITSSGRWWELNRAGNHFFPHWDDIHKPERSVSIFDSHLLELNQTIHATIKRAVSHNSVKYTPTHLAQILLSSNDCNSFPHLYLSKAIHRNWIYFYYRIVFLGLFMYIIQKGVWAAVWMTHFCPCT